jgi:hypothetical protein
MIGLDLYASGTFPMSLAIRIKSLFESNPFKVVKTNYYRFLYRRYKKSHGLEKYSKILTTNQKLPSNNIYQKVNFFDYEESRKPDNGTIIQGDYILFLDQFFPLHPDDIKRNGSNPKKQSEIYLKQLNRFFESIEEKYRQKVVIALHPKSRYTNADFGDRTTIKGETRVLVKYAQFVLMHHTLSISYMVLYNKPLLFLCSDNIKKYYRSNYLMIKTLTLFFEAPLINISKEEAIPEPVLPIEKYKEYKYDYLTNPEIESIPNSELILNTIKELDKP